MRPFFGIWAQFCSFVGCFEGNFGVIAGPFLVLLLHLSLLWRISMPFWPFQVFWGGRGVQIAQNRRKTG